MTASVRMGIRIFLSVVFIVSLYGGMTLLTALMFAKGHIMMGVISGLVLAMMTAAAVGLAGLAWSMARMEDSETAEGLGFSPQHG